MDLAKRQPKIKSALEQAITRVYPSLRHRVLSSRFAPAKENYKRYRLGLQESLLSSQQVSGSGPTVSIYAGLKRDACGVAILMISQRLVRLFTY